MRQLVKKLLIAFITFTMEMVHGDERYRCKQALGQKLYLKKRMIRRRRGKHYV
jgi:hypothetical protein